MKRQSEYAAIGQFVYQRYRKAAQCAVKKAVTEKRLSPAMDLICVDCGKHAMAHDHRDYDHPMIVAPVCYGCNNKRGMAHLGLGRIDCDLSPYWGDGLYDSEFVRGLLLRENEQ